MRDDLLETDKSVESSMQFKLDAKSDFENVYLQMATNVIQSYDNGERRRCSARIRSDVGHIYYTRGDYAVAMEMFRIACYRYEADGWNELCVPLKLMIAKCAKHINEYVCFVSTCFLLLADPSSKHMLSTKQLKWLQEYVLQTCTDLTVPIKLIDLNEIFPGSSLLVLDNDNVVNSENSAFVGEPLKLQMTFDCKLPSSVEIDALGLSLQAPSGSPDGQENQPNVPFSILLEEDDVTLTPGENIVIFESRNAVNEEGKYQVTSIWAEIPNVTLTGSNETVVNIQKRSPKITIDMFCRGEANSLLFGLAQPLTVRLATNGDGIQEGSTLKITSETLAIHREDINFQEAKEYVKRTHKDVITLNDCPLNTTFDIDIPVIAAVPSSAAEPQSNKLCVQIDYTNLSGYSLTYKKEMNFGFVPPLSMECNVYKLGRVKFLKILVLCLSSNPIRIKSYNLTVPPQFRVSNDPNPIPTNQFLTTLLEGQKYSFAFELSAGAPSPVSETRQPLRRQNGSFQIDCTYQNLSKPLGKFAETNHQETQMERGEEGEEEEGEEENEQIWSLSWALALSPVSADKSDNKLFQVTVSSPPNILSGEMLKLSILINRSAVFTEQSDSDKLICEIVANPDDWLVCNQPTLIDLPVGHKAMMTCGLLPVAGYGVVSLPTIRLKQLKSRQRFANVRITDKDCFEDVPEALISRKYSSDKVNVDPPNSTLASLAGVGRRKLLKRKFG